MLSSCADDGARSDIEFSVMSGRSSRSIGSAGSDIDLAGDNGDDVNRMESCTGIIFGVVIASKESSRGLFKGGNSGKSDNGEDKGEPDVSRIFTSDSSSGTFVWMAKIGFSFFFFPSNSSHMSSRSSRDTSSGISIFNYCRTSRYYGGQ